MNAKFQSPLLGYNNNVRHKGKVFHIQTEDSGAKYGHIITHLFMDGGRILKSVKTGYAEYIGNERMADIVKEMMKQQHKAMFIALRDGKFDAIAELGGTPEPAAVVARTEPAPPPAAPAASVKVNPPTPPAPAVASAKPPPPVPREDIEPQTIRQPEPSELTLDIDALERAAAASHLDSPGMRHQSELPPPPANLFRDRGGGGKYRMTPVPPVAQTGKRGSAPAPKRATPPPPAATGRASQAGVPAAGERRYAPTRPAAIFGQAKPQPNKSVFGEDLISDKSLDEVILSYLAEDLDEKK